MVALTRPATTLLSQIKVRPEMLRTCASKDEISPEKEFEKLLSDASKDYFTNRLKSIAKKTFGYEEAKSVCMDQKRLVSEIPKEIQNKVLQNAYFKGTKVAEFAKSTFKKESKEAIFCPYHNFRKLQSSLLLNMRSFVRAGKTEDAIQTKGKFSLPSKTAKFAKELILGLEARELGVLGKGSISTCRKVQVGNEEFARKSVPMFVSNEPNGVFEYHLHASLLPHPHIVDVCLLTKKFTRQSKEVSFESKLEAYLECADCDLSSYMKNGGFSQEEALLIAFQVANGLSYMHEKEVIHCDVKPPNILIFKKDGKLTAKVADFSHSAQKVQDSPGGTLNVRSPEMLEHKINQKQAPEVGAKTDVWSFGVLLYSLVVASDISPWSKVDEQLPSEKNCKAHLETLHQYLESNQEEFLRKQVKENGGDINSPLFPIMVSCLQSKDKRPSMREVVGQLFRLLYGGRHCLV